MKDFLEITVWKNREMVEDILKEPKFSEQERYRAAMRFLTSLSPQEMAMLLLSYAQKEKK